MFICIYLMMVPGKRSQIFVEWMNVKYYQLENKYQDLESGSSKE